MRNEKLKRYKLALILLSILAILEGVLVIHLWSLRARKVAVPSIPIRGKIAIVIDDWGYNLNNLAILDKIKYPLTCAVLPNLDYSRTVSEELHKRKFEIILHLPLEPMEQYRLEKDTILTSLDEPTIISIFRKDLMSVPYAKGVSNHMGSKVTKDLRTMEILFRELKRRHLYFLDSLVTAESVGFELAGKMHLLFAKRDIFLDNQEEPEYIKRQINLLKTRARFYGQAIGISHDRRVTLEVLKEVMPQLEKEGYRLVFVSELVR